MKKVKESNIHLASPEYHITFKRSHNLLRPSLCHHPEETYHNVTMKFHFLKFPFPFCKVRIMWEVEPGKGVPILWGIPWLLRFDSRAHPQLTSHWLIESWSASDGMET